jgi:hypothetical protein
MNKRYIIAGTAFVAFLFIVSAIFVPQIGTGSDESRSVVESYILESPHNYYNDMDEIYTIHVPGAEWISAHFYRYDLERRVD